MLLPGAFLVRRNYFCMDLYLILATLHQVAEARANRYRIVLCYSAFLGVGAGRRLGYESLVGNPWQSRAWASLRDTRQVADACIVFHTTCSYK